MNSPRRAGHQQRDLPALHHLRHGGADLFRHLLPAHLSGRGAWNGASPPPAIAEDIAHGPADQQSRPHDRDAQCQQMVRHVPGAEGRVVDRAQGRTRWSSAARRARANPPRSAASTGWNSINRGRSWSKASNSRQDFKNIELIRREVGMVFQQFNLFPHLTILQNLTLAPRRVRKMPRAEAERSGHALSHARAALPNRRINIPASFPAASSSASPSPAPCAWNPR